MVSTTDDTLQQNEVNNSWNTSGPTPKNEQWAAGWKEVMYRASGICKAQVKCRATDVAGQSLPQANLQHATALICFVIGHIQCLLKTMKDIKSHNISFPNLT